MAGAGSALIAALLVAAVVVRRQKRLGGVTGDIFGCLIELTECRSVACCLR
ncbi:MAG: adenosylcobinamide-GDP ribazoletransferase [Bilophila wadsworthia]